MQPSYGYSDAWKAIIRPPRDQYTEDELGPKVFMLGPKKYKRTDMVIMNDRKLKLQCSFFEPVERVAKELPCVIFLHGNSSSRVEGIPFARIFLPSNITFFCFDFSGSGQSEGEFISLGWWEREDVKSVVDYLRSMGTVSTIGLWGRSMGAATALLHSDRDPSIAGLVLDSPFASLSQLTDELAKKYAPSVPGFILSGLQWFVKGSIKSRAKFDINNLNPIEHAHQAFIPALFIVAKGDDFILPKHGIALYEKYAGDKNLIQVDGDHNSIRPDHALTTIYIFFYTTLQVKDLIKGSKMEIPNISKMEFPKHVIPDSIIVNHAPLNLEEEDEEFRAAIELSKLTAQMEEEERKKMKK